MSSETGSTAVGTEVPLAAREVRKQVVWRDLVPLTPRERLWECTLSLPWLVGSVAAYHQAGGMGRAAASEFPFDPVWLLSGMVCSFFFFLTGLRQSHNAQHACLGIGRAGHHAMLLALSGLMLASMHAVRVTHLHHHRHCLDDHDHEAAHASWPAWKVLLMGPVLLVRMHTGAWSLADRASRAWIALELLLAAGVVGLALGVPELHALRWHVLAMLVGECLTGFFAVWIVHRGCDAHTQIARTQRGWLTNLMTYSMLYHLEHHLWPAVPTCHLDRLASRLDQASPELSRRQVCSLSE